MTGPPARHSDPVGLARLQRVIAAYLAQQHPGTRWRLVYDDELPNDAGSGGNGVPHQVGGLDDPGPVGNGTPLHPASPD